MPKFTSQVPCQEDPQSVDARIGGLLASRGFKPHPTRKGIQWGKGIYWRQYVKFSQVPGTVNLEVWNFCPLPGMGSFLIYFIGVGQLRALHSDLQQFVAMGPYAAAVAAPMIPPATMAVAAPAQTVPAWAAPVPPVPPVPAAAPGQAAPAWAPTCQVPDGGMAYWETPDPSRAAAGQLAARLELAVDSVAGAWARVRASNGWQGWVDGGLLIGRG